MTRTVRLVLLTLVLTTVVALVAVVSFAAGVAVAAPDPAAHPRPRATTSVPATTSPATPLPGSTSPGSPATSTPRADLDALIAARPEGSVSVAAENLDTGDRYGAGTNRGQWLASVYKLLVLVALLQARGADGLDAHTRELAAAMIRRSDNRAGYELYRAVGGARTLSDTATRLGLRRTVAGRSDPAFTTSSATDCLRLLRAATQPGPLSPASSDVARDLLRTVQADQRWGVGAADDDGAFANKNGWLAVDDGNGPGENDGGRWIVNSVGVVEAHGQQVLVAVLTQHGSSLADGIALTERLARRAVALVA